MNHFITNAPLCIKLKMIWFLILYLTTVKLPMELCYYRFGLVRTVFLISRLTLVNTTVIYVQKIQKKKVSLYL